MRRVIIIYFGMFAQNRSPKITVITIDVSGAFVKAFLRFLVFISRGSLLKP
jgi:hypothetical protein